MAATTAPVAASSLVHRAGAAVRHPHCGPSEESADGPSPTPMVATTDGPSGTSVAADAGSDPAITQATTVPPNTNSDPASRPPQTPCKPKLVPLHPFPLLQGALRTPPPSFTDSFRSARHRAPAVPTAVQQRATTKLCGNPLRRLRGTAPRPGRRSPRLPCQTPPNDRSEPITLSSLDQRLATIRSEGRAPRAPSRGAGRAPNVRPESPGRASSVAPAATRLSWAGRSERLGNWYQDGLVAAQSTATDRAADIAFIVAGSSAADASAEAVSGQKLDVVQVGDRRVPDSVFAPLVPRWTSPGWWR